MGIPSGRQHDQTAEVRLDVMRDAAYNLSLWPPSESWYMPCLDDKEPTPFMAGKVAWPERPELDTQEIWLLSFRAAGDKTGYLIERPDMVPLEQPPHRQDWSKWSMTTLTEAHGRQWLGDGSFMPRPMSHAAYGGLRQLLKKTVFTPETTNAALVELRVGELHQELDGRWEKFDASLRRRSRVDHYRSEIGRRMLAAARAGVKVMERGNYSYLSWMAGVQLPLPDDPDSDKLP